MKKGVIFLVLAVTVGVAYILWLQYSAKEKAEREIGLDAARMVDATFAKSAELKVGTLKGKVTATASYDGPVFDAKQTSTIPATVDYFIDLRRLGKNSYRWASGSKTLFVEIPEVRPAEPNLNEAAAVIKQEGVIVTRKAGREMSKQISDRAARRAAEEAKKPENLNQAGDNAREVIARITQLPLNEVGLGEVRVVARFPSERNDSATPLSEIWDRSRRYEDVLRELREKRQPQ